MNYSNIRITLDMQEACSGVSILVKKKDIGRKIYITLMDDGIPYSITEGCTAAFTAEKPDGKIVYDECEISGNTIIYEVAAQVVAVPGRHECEMKLYGADGKLLTSPCFDIIVDETVYEAGDEVEAPSRPTRVLFAPDGCQEGQFLKVAKVSDDGKGTVVELESGPSATDVNGKDADVYALVGYMNKVKNGSVGLSLYKNGQACNDTVYLRTMVSSGGSEWREHGSSTGSFKTSRSWSFGGTDAGMAWRCEIYSDSSKANLLASCFIYGGANGESGSDYVLTDADKAEIAEMVVAAIPNANGVSF